jgi:hypothetical protein
MQETKKDLKRDERSRILFLIIFGFLICFNQSVLFKVQFLNFFWLEHVYILNPSKAGVYLRWH